MSDGVNWLWMNGLGVHGPYTDAALKKWLDWILESVEEDLPEYFYPLDFNYKTFIVRDERFEIKI